jgi:protein-S-isoprenylcysteine O-methyltransferase Ste14
MTDRADRPDVIAPPPLIYLAALIGGIALHWLIPLALPIPVAARWAGAALLVSGFALGATGRREFAKAGTHVNPMKPTTVLVRSRPFTISRNPMYVAMGVAFTGIALLTRVAWLLILLPPVLALMHWGVVRREERYLAHKFGAEYEAYRARVRRYF